MNKILKAIGWKTPSNRWDKVEIVTDITLISVMTALILIAIIYSKYYI